MLDLGRIKRLRTLVEDERGKVIAAKERFENPFFKNSADYTIAQADTVLRMLTNSDLHARLYQVDSLASLEPYIDLFLTQPRKYLEHILETCGPDVETVF